MNIDYFKSTLAFFLIVACTPLHLNGITITPVIGSPFTGLINTQFSGLAYSPNGKWLAVGNSEGADSVSIYAVASNGVIAEISGSPFATNGTSPQSVTYSPDGKFLVAANYGDFPSTISLFSVDQTTGALTQLNPATGVPSTNTLTISSTREVGSLTYSPNGEFLAVYTAVTGDFANVVMFGVNSSTGALTQLAPSLRYASTTHPFNAVNFGVIAFSPDGTHLARANLDNTNTITIFTVSPSGVLGPLNAGVYGTDYTVPGGSGFFDSIDYSPDGKLLVVIDQNGNLFTFTLNNGVPTYAAIAPTASHLDDFFAVFSPDSQFIAVAALNSAYIYVLSVTASGAMTQVAQLSAPQSISQLAFSPLGDPIWLLSGTGSSDPVYTGFGFIASYTLGGSSSSPTNLTARRTCNRFLLQTDLINLITWSAPASGSPAAYNIYRDPALTQLIAIVPATSPLQFYDHDRQPNVTYTYYITAVDSSGNSSLASSVSIVASYTLGGSSSPTNLTASRTRNRFLLQADLINLITWSAPASGSPAAYNIYRDPALTQLIAIVPATSPLQFYDHDRQPNVTYTYYITAVDSSGNSSLASSVSIVG
jgi:6-phosphogluconolactonase (cycloisomerase 2 family)